jgi:hypothetical protein
MRLYIQIVDGEPHDHPLIETNMQHLFGEQFDPENPPEGFAHYEMSPPPNFIDIYDVAEYHYEWKEDRSGVKQVWTTRSMTDEEKEREVALLKQETVDMACHDLEWTKSGFDDYTNQLKALINNPVPWKEIEWPQRPAGSWRDS